MDTSIRLSHTHDTKIESILDAWRTCTKNNTLPYLRGEEPSLVMPMRCSGCGVLIGHLGRLIQFIHHVTYSDDDTSEQVRLENSFNHLNDVTTLNDGNHIYSRKINHDETPHVRNTNNVDSSDTRMSNTNKQQRAFQTRRMINKL